jgi:hypothetical protein
MLLWWWTGVLAGGVAAPVVFNPIWAANTNSVVGFPVPQPQAQ